MKIDFDMLEKLAAAGATAQVIIELWRQHEAEKAPKRARERERQKARRANKQQQPATNGNIGQQQATPSQTAEKELYALGKRLMGRSAGGLISSLIRHHNYDLAAARRMVDTAATKSDPREYVVASMRSKNGAGNPTMAAFDDLIARTEGGTVEDDSSLVDVTPRRS
jgi:hypothetical protein